MSADAGPRIASGAFGEHRARMETERGIQRARGVALLAGVAQTLILQVGRPHLLWLALGLLGLGWAVAAGTLRSQPAPRALARIGWVVMAVDVVVAALVMASSVEDPADPVQLVALFLAAEGAVRWGRAGGIVLGAVGGVMAAGWSVAVHADQDLPLPLGFVTFRLIVVVIIGVLLGTTVDALRRQRRVAETVWNASRDLIATFDRSGAILNVNPACEAILGYRADEVVGRDRAELIAPGHRPPGRPVQEAFENGSSRLLELPFVHRDGHHVWLELDLQADRDEGLVYAIGRDVSARRRHEDDLRHRADHDALTGAANRGRLVAHLDRGLRRERGLALLFVDLDGFKGVNDAHGHGAGDRVLVEVADRLRRVAGPDDLVARLAGDEFCVLVDDPVAAEGAARRVAVVLAEPFAVADGGVGLTASVGVAVGGPGDTPAGVLERADRAMYTQKRARRGPRPAVPSSPGSPAPSRT